MTIENALTASSGVQKKELDLLLPFFELADYSKNTAILTEGKPVDKTEFIKEDIHTYTKQLLIIKYLKSIHN